MSQKTPPISHGNLPENPPKPKNERHRTRIPHSLDFIPASWTPQSERSDRRDACEGCGIAKTVDEYSKFFARDLDLDADTCGPMLCNYCITYGVPLADPLRDLNLRERQALLVLASGGTTAEAARILEVDPSTLYHKLTGRDRSLFRDAFLRMCVNAGLGPDSIIKALSRAMKGKKYQWDPKAEAFHEFEDHNAQLRATNSLIKLYDLNPPTELARNTDPHRPGSVNVQIVTNVGDGKDIDVGVYEVEAKRSS